LRARRVLSHTADTGIEVSADTLADLVGELCLGMFELMARVPGGAVRRSIEIEVKSASVEDLIVDTLSELLSRAEVEDLIVDEVSVSMGKHGLSASLHARGAPLDMVEQCGPPIKAVSYHRLEVERRGGVWHGRVYFDV